MRYLPAAVLDLAARQHSVVTRAQLLGLGCSSKVISRWLAVGLLVRAAAGVYLIAGAARYPRQQLAMRLARAGPLARAGGRWACALHGLEGFDLAGPGHLVIPADQRVRGVDFTVVRTRLDPVDLAVVDGYRTLSVARALIDVLPAAGARRTRVGYDDARRRRLVTRRELQERAEALGRTRGAAQMRALIASGQLHRESEGERCVDDLWRPGDPRPVPQVWVHSPSGRWYRLDFAFLDSRLALEYHGRRFHGDRPDIDNDAFRDLDLADMRIHTLRITAGMVRSPVAIRRRILAVHEERLGYGLPPITPGEGPVRW
jgi:hypothetical protein